MYTPNVAGLKLRKKIGKRVDLSKPPGKIRSTGSCRLIVFRCYFNSDVNNGEKQVISERLKSRAHYENGIVTITPKPVKNRSRMIKVPGTAGAVDILSILTGSVSAGAAFCRRIFVYDLQAQSFDS